LIVPPFAAALALNSINQSDLRLTVLPSLASAWARFITRRIVTMFNRIAIVCLCSIGLLLQFDRVVAAPVNINSADAATFARELKGVGDTKAAAIVEYRRTHGAFKTVDDLALVKGIGQKLVDRNRADLRIGRLVPAAAPPASGKPAVTAKPAGPPAASGAAPRR